MDKIIEEFIPYPEALCLKKLGFNKECIAIFVEKRLEIHGKTSLNSLENDGLTNSNLNTDKIITAPTFSQAFRFFRNNYNLDNNIKKLHFGENSIFTGYYCTINENNNIKFIHGADECTKTYEECELKCLQELIKIANKIK